MTFTEQQRALIFWLGCIPTRVYLTNRAKRDAPWLRVFAAGVGFYWLTGQAMSVEGVFGGPAWWAEDRTTHGVLWAAYALSGNWHFLAGDTAFGAANWWVNKF